MCTYACKTVPPRSLDVRPREGAVGRDCPRRSRPYCYKYRTRSSSLDGFRMVFIIICFLLIPPPKVYIVVLAVTVAFINSPPIAT